MTGCQWRRGDGMALGLDTWQSYVMTTLPVMMGWEVKSWNMDFQTTLSLEHVLQGGLSVCGRDLEVNEGQKAVTGSYARYRKRFFLDLCYLRSSVGHSATAQTE